MIEPLPVVLEHCPVYELRRLHEFFDQAAGCLDLPGSFSGRVVLLKPNLVSGYAPPLACTDGRFLRALAEWFLDRNARLLLGDSPAFGSTASVLNRQQIAPLLSGLPVRLVEFTTPRPVRLAHGVAINVAEEALACDLFVNVPKLKAHSQMYLTAAVKNVFGIVCGMKKAIAHMRHGNHQTFATIMLDLLELLPEHVTFVDGIDAMHRHGPARGELLPVGCCAAGRSPVGIDRALLDALELAVQRCPISAVALKLGIGGAGREELFFPLAVPESFHGSGFVAPRRLNPVVFNPLRFLVSIIRRACGRDG